MIQIINIIDKIQNANIPVTLRGTEWQTHLNRVIGGSTISDKFYRGENNDIVDKLQSIYENKCAYCENKEFRPSVEHYRPKGKVITSYYHFERGIKKKKQRTLNASGYNWLCYEWTNLLPICDACNRVSSGKGMQFPLIKEGKMKRSHTVLADGSIDLDKCKAHLPPLIDEQPYIIHPEVDNPSLFLKLKSNGRLKGIDTKNRGRATIQICDLNRRNLVEERKKIIFDIVGDINFAFFLYKKLIKRQNENFLQRIITSALSVYNKKRATEQLKIQLEIYFEKIKEGRQPSTQYSFVYRSIYDNFERIVVPLLTNSNTHQLVLKLFEQFKQQNP